MLYFWTDSSFLFWHTALKFHTLVIFQREERNVTDETPLSGWCKYFILLPLPRMPQLVGCPWQPWSLVWKSLKHIDVFSSINHIRAPNNREHCLNRAITFLIKKRINILTVTFIIIANGIFRTQKRSLFQAKLPQYNPEKLLINVEYSN